MNQIRLEFANREIIKAIMADEKANANYYQVIKSFISNESARLEGRLDSSDLKDY